MRGWTVAFLFIKIVEELDNELFFHLDLFLGKDHILTLLFRVRNILFEKQCLSHNGSINL